MLLFCIGVGGSFRGSTSMGYSGRRRLGVIPCHLLFA